MLKENERITVREDAFGDAPRLVKYRGQTGKVTRHWMASGSMHAGLVLIRLDNGESLYVFGNEVAPLQVTVGDQAV